MRNDVASSAINIADVLAQQVSIGRPISRNLRNMCIDQRTRLFLVVSRFVYVRQPTPLRFFSFGATRSHVASQRVYFPTA